MTIFKLTSYGDSEDPHIEYGTSESTLESQIKVWEKEGYGVADDTIEKISFKDLKELCVELNKRERNNG